MAYLFIIVGANVAKLTRVKHLKWVVVALLVLLIWFPSMAALERQFGTQFFGLDVAGEFIKSESDPSERIFHSSHQNYGLLWHADRKGYKMPNTVEEMIDGEEKGATWIFIYQWKFDLFQND
jgi:hypothetical protein